MLLFLLPKSANSCQRMPRTLLCHYEESWVELPAMGAQSCRRRGKVSGHAAFGAVVTQRAGTVPSKKVVLVGNQEGLLEAIAAQLRLEANVCVLGPLPDPAAAARQCRDGTADLVVVELDACSGDRAAIIAQMRELAAGVPLLLLDTDWDAHAVREVLRLRIEGVLRKADALERISHVIRDLLDGCLVMPPDILGKIVIDTNGLRFRSEGKGNRESELNDRPDG